MRIKLWKSSIILILVVTAIAGLTMKNFALLKLVARDDGTKFQTSLQSLPLNKRFQSKELVSEKHSNNTGTHFARKVNLQRNNADILRISNEADIPSTSKNSSLPLKMIYRTYQKPKDEPMTIKNLTEKARYKDLALNYSQSIDPIILRHLKELSLQPQTSLMPWPNETSLAYAPGRFYSGYRNQMMGFTMLVLHAIKYGHGQIVINSLQMKDTYGSNRRIPFSNLWDVPHFNSFYPKLPRLVVYDKFLHDQFNPEIRHNPWNRKGETLYCNPPHRTLCTNVPVRPHAAGDNRQFLPHYQTYAKGKGPYTGEKGHRNEAEILMLQKALRPHPDLLTILNEKYLQMMVDDNLKENQFIETVFDSKKYLTLHARIEPDMQAHPVCRDKKVLKLADIFRILEDHWNTTAVTGTSILPFSRIFLPVNRQLLEEEVKKKGKKKNMIAYENLRTLNHARDHGLWNGQVRIFEFGAKALENSTFHASMTSTAGAMLNFFLGVNASVFIGTEVSSYSHDLLATRFFRNQTTNFAYRPTGLIDWTPEGTIDPPGFRC